MVIKMNKDNKTPKKTVLEYLEHCRDMACHNLFCCSATYDMGTPKVGKEKEFAEATRDVEIVDELFQLATMKDVLLNPKEDEKP